LKKIAIIADALDFQYAGIKVYLEGLVNAVREVDQENEYLLIRANQDLRDVAGEIYVKSHVSKYLHPKSRLLIEIPEAIKKIKPDITVEPCHFGPFRLPKNIKRVTIIHDITPVTHPQFHPRESVLLHKLLLPGVIKRTDLILTNSNSTKEDVEHFYPASIGKTEVLYPGFIHRTFKKDSLPIQRFGVQENEYILHVGTREPRKNLSFLLDVFEEIKRTDQPGYKLVITGNEGWRHQLFDSKLAEHPYKDDIILTGFVSDVELAQLYKHADCLMFTSLYEGFGLPLLEAMNYGCPVMTFDNSSQKEVCANSAIYLEIEDPIIWKNAWTRLKSSTILRNELKMKGQEQALHFDWHISAQRFINEMNSIQL
jgi:glycosyltransferase involved in cell wall biosynthesis